MHEHEVLGGTVVRLAWEPGSLLIANEASVTQLADPLNW
jgi:hypothetical protein